MNKKRLGNIGEIIALNYYKSLGYSLVIKNFYTKYGELDLAVLKGGSLRFVEVKTRINTNLENIYEQITNKKISNIKKSLNIFLQSNKIGFNNIYIDFAFLNLKDNFKKLQLEIITLD